MAISDREANALVSVYLILRKAVLIFGVAGLLILAVMALASVYRAGREKGRGDVVVPVSGAAKGQAEERPAPPARHPVRHRRIAAPPEPVIDEPKNEEPEAEPENEAAPVAAAPVSIAEPAAGPAPAVVFVATVGEKHFIAHHKGRGGCDGNLILSDTRLRFDCPLHPERDLNLERNAVAAHDDGIRDIASGRKYHFKVNGLDKQGARVLFNRWVRDGMAAELAAGGR